MTDIVSKEEVKRRTQVLVEVCKNAGLRMTDKRLAIFKEVARTGAHPDAETVFSKVRKKIPNISLDTVYRNLTQLEQIGMLNRVDPLCGRARFDANGDEHHHFVCEKCLTVIDIYLSKGESLAIPKSSEKFGSVTSVHLQARGICHTCSQKEKAL